VTFTKCTVRNTTINGLGTDGGSVGGILGCANGSNDTKNSIFENITIEGVTISAPKGAADVSRGNGYILGTIVKEDRVITIKNVKLGAGNKMVSNFTAHQLIGGDRSGKNQNITIDGEKVTISADLFITNAEQFRLFRDAVNNGTDYSGKTVKLVADIDLGKVEFKPIGTGSAKFSGTFDGVGHTISGLLNDASQANISNNKPYGRGLFGVIYNATLRDFTVDGAKVGGDVNAYENTRPLGNINGAVVGYAYGKVAIDNVNVTNSTIVGYGKVAGIVGSYQDTTGQIDITNCSVSNTTISACQYIASMVGFSCMKENTNLSNCTIDNVTVNICKDTSGSCETVEGKLYWLWNYNNEKYFYYPIVANWYTDINDTKLNDNSSLTATIYDNVDTCKGELTVNNLWTTN
jgi:hypothetical protein